MQAKAFIAGCGGLALTADERSFFAAERPFGLILFARNCKTAEQIADLTREFRDRVERADAPVLIDQEGGRVQRLKPPGWPAYPTAAAIGALPRGAAARAAWLSARLIAADLAALGVNVDCLPVLDVPVPGGHEIIGDRAYGSDPQLVADLGRAAARGLLDGGVLPVAKHIPGHGRAAADSHLALPVVAAAAAELEQDLLPFRLNCDLPMAMTAHVVYTALDRDRPATLSPRIIESVIRERIGFRGFLMTDDLSMRALSGDFGDRARASLHAGCDCVLHCNGDMSEMRQVAAAVPELVGKAAERAATALRALTPPAPFDLAAARVELAALLAGDPLRSAV